MNPVLAQGDACHRPALLTGTVIVPLFIGIGFVLWALMGTPLSELQATRYILAWAVDRTIPAPLGDVSEKDHSPIMAIIFRTVTGAQDMAHTADDISQISHVS